jgi:hypothetical protein
MVMCNCSLRVGFLVAVTFGFTIPPALSDTGLVGEARTFADDPPRPSPQMAAETDVTPVAAILKSLRNKNDPRHDFMGFELSDAARRVGPPAVPLLIEALRDPDRDVVRYAVMALRNLGKHARTAIPAMQGDTPSRRIRRKGSGRGAWCPRT